MKKRDELDASRAMEADCTIGAGAGFGKYTPEVAEQRRNRDKRPGSSAGIYCHHDGCVELLTLSRTTTVQPTYDDDYQMLMPARDEAAFLGWRVYRSVWWCPAHVVAKKLACARCLMTCPACSCMGGSRGDAVDGEKES